MLKRQDKACSRTLILASAQLGSDPSARVCRNMKLAGLTQGLSRTNPVKVQSWRAVPRLIGLAAMRPIIR